MKAIDIRRSVRKFKDRPVEADKVEKLLRAAMQAPSARNQQAWEFIVIEDPEMAEKIAGMGKYAFPASEAPLVIVVAGNENHITSPKNFPSDLSASIQNILIEAVTLGLGSTWIGVHPNEDKMTYLAGVLDLPNNIIPFSIIALGYPYSEDANRYIDRFLAERVHYGKY